MADDRGRIAINSERRSVEDGARSTSGGRWTVDGGGRSVDGAWWMGTKNGEARGVGEGLWVRRKDLNFSA